MEGEGGCTCREGCASLVGQGEHAEHGAGLVTGALVVVGGVPQVPIGGG